MVPLTDIEHRRGRLLVSVFAVLGGFATLSVAFSLLGPSVLEPLQLTPTAARVGVLVLTIGFIALVWEKEQHFGDLNRTVARQEVLLAAFENRIKVVESLLEATGSLHVPIAVDDVMNVILSAAVELVEAESGSIELTEEESGDIQMSRSHFTDDPSPSTERRVFARFPLATGGRSLGVLTLTMPPAARGFDDPTFEVLERFTVQAAHALGKAQLLAKERATVAYLEAANVVKARFLTTVSHELRTPLTSVLGFSSTLEHHWERLDDDDKQAFVKEIHVQSRKLGGIVESLLEAARVELQGFVVDPVLHDVRQSVHEAVKPFLDEHGSRIVVEFPRQAVEAELDPFVVDEIVSNLVDNAVRYTNGRVKISLDLNPQTVVIRVQDQGPGMNPTYLDRVTDPFYRLSKSPVDRGGIGLHLVRTLIESHGGRGEIESDDDGTRASVVLPRSAATGASSRLLDPIVR